MKEQFLKWIKRYGVTVWLIAAILALAATASYAAYVNLDINKFVLMTGKGNQAFFGSNYLYLTNSQAEPAQYSSRRIPQTPKADSEGIYTFSVMVCNYVYGNPEMWNLDNIDYTFGVKLYQNGSGSTLPAGFKNVSVTVDSSKYQPNESGVFDFPQMTLTGGVTSDHTYVFDVPAALKDELMFEVTATPANRSYSATNNQKLAALITLAEKTPPHGWSGKFLDSTSHAPSEYSGFNYEISGTGTGTIVLTWDKSLQISPWFLSDNHLTPQYDETTGSIELTVGAENGPSAYQFQFYKADKDYIDGLDWDNLKGLVTVAPAEDQSASG